MSIPFTRIPQIASGQAASAVSLNTYTRGLQYLLGESHAPVVASRGTGLLETYFDTYQTKALYYAYYPGNDATFDYLLEVNIASGHTYHVAFYALINEVETLITELTGAGNSTYQRLSGSVDVSGLGLVMGCVYEIRVKLRSDDEFENTWTGMYLWNVAFMPTMSGYWTTPPTFVDGLSNPTQANVLRTDLNNLASRMVSPINPLYYSGNGEGVFNSQSHLYTTVPAGLCYLRYRPGVFRVQIEVTAEYNAEFQWRVIETDGGTTLWESTPERGSYMQYAWRQSGDITLAGYTFGNWYPFAVQVRVRDYGDSEWLDWSNHPVYVRQIIPQRLSTGTPAAGWATPPSWSYGGTNLSAARLNAVSTDLAMFYTGGAECLWGETRGVLFHNTGDHHIYSGYHRRRYLVYQAIDGSTPEIHWGATFRKEGSLDSEAGRWHTADLVQTGVPWGGLYYVANARVAFECSHPIL